MNHWIPDDHQRANDAQHAAPPSPPEFVRGQFRLTREVYRRIEDTIGSRRAEHGGILGGHRGDGVVREYYYDHSAYRADGAYSPDTRTINRILAEDWKPRGLSLLGFVHSHPGGLAEPSEGDRFYASRILQALPGLDQLLLPIVFSIPDTGRFELFAFAARRDCQCLRIERQHLVLLDQ